jgi:hypothetical protein
MDWEFEYHESSNHMEARVKGDLSTEGLNAMTTDLLAEMRKRDCRKLLFDYSGISSALNVVDFYKRSAESERIGASRVNRVVAVVPEKFLQEFGFMETVYRNRGFDVTIFTGKGPAVRHLESAE